MIIFESVENGNVDGTSGEDATQNKFGSQTANTKSIPQQIQVESAKMEELNVDNDKYGRRSQIGDTNKKSTTKIGSLDSSASGNVFAIRSPGNGVVRGGYLGLPSPELFGGHQSYLAVPAGAGQIAAERFQDGCCGGSWFSRSGKFCTPINLEPCIPLIPRACGN
ncbi:unnamed protein product [Anisakis simplex]|uniref:Uncharacterized protein n=1 Tax=Anisakis simplex TaxID=6269 RepID=A0A0M3K9R2_ANISI|nr:unnamed protein product [Anisakis simplex]